LRTSAIEETDRDLIQLDRALDRLGGNRNQATLPGEAEHEQVGRDGIAEQRRGKTRPVDEGRGGRVANRGDDGRLHLPDRELPVRIAGEVGRRRGGEIGDHPGAPRRHPGEGLAPGGDENVAPEHRVRRREADARRIERLAGIGEAQVAHHRAVLLRQACDVEHGHRLALQVRRHAQQLAHRDHAGAADSRHHQGVGAVDGGNRRRGKILRDRRGDGRLLRRGRGGGLAGPGPRAAQLAAMNRDEARAKAVDAREVLVA
jgi:hypothetical protein